MATSYTNRTAISSTAHGTDRVGESWFYEESDINYEASNILYETDQSTGITPTYTNRSAVSTTQTVRTSP